MLYNQRNGFSLVELMAVVSIITILSAVTLPLYRTFVARSRMGEAKANLLHIAALQAIYRSENASYYTGLSVGNVGGVASCDTSTSGAEMLNELGFQPDGCGQLRYGYTTVSGVNYFSGTADYSGSPASKQVFPDCSEQDTWVISTGTSKPDHVNNAVTACE